MRHISRTLCIAAIALVSTQGSVFANGYKSGAKMGSSNHGLISKNSDYATDVEYGSGWYIRGDIGHSFIGTQDISFNRVTASGSPDVDIDQALSIGAGIGYIFDDFFRADLTFGMQSDRGWSGSTSGCGTNATTLVAYTGDCSASNSGEFDAFTGLMNVYANIGKFNRFSAYVGAGIGLANVNYGTTNSALNCTLDPGETCELGVHSGGATAETFTGTQAFNGGSSLNLAYSISTGFDFKLTDTLTMDVGYRMLNIEGGPGFGASTGSGSVEFEGASLHEVRAGLRYEIW